MTKYCNARYQRALEAELLGNFITVDLVFVGGTVVFCHHFVDAHLVAPFQISVLGIEFIVPKRPAMGSPYYYQGRGWHNGVMPSLPYSEKLLIVSGKGGTGKTVLASALAAVCASSGPTILVSIDGNQPAHPVFDAPLAYEPREILPDLWIADLDSLSAVREYVKRKVPFSGLYDSFLTSRMFRDFAEAAPGFQELMSLGKIYDLVSESRFQRVVVDAPSTGHLMTLLDVPAATANVVQVGPLNHNARKIHDMLLDPERTRVLLTALPEEMAIREARELHEFCVQRRMNVGPVLVNQHVARRFDPEEVEQLMQLQVADGLAAGVKAACAEAELAGVQELALSGLDDIDYRLLPRLTTHTGEDLIERLGLCLSSGAAGD
jgi:anion-transporting  ArsA/GET3 family ATPase